MSPSNVLLRGHTAAIGDLGLAVPLASARTPVTAATWGFVALAYVPASALGPGATGTDGWDSWSNVPGGIERLSWFSMETSAVEPYE